MLSTRSAKSKKSKRINKRDPFRQAYPLKKLPVGMSWMPYAIYYLQTKHTDGRQLSIAIAQAANEWHAVAVETAANTTSVSDVLDNHSHQDLGDHASFLGIQTIAIGYAKKWRRRKSKSETCSCDIITN